MIRTTDGRLTGALNNLNSNRALRRLIQAVLDDPRVDIAAIWHDPPTAAPSQTDVHGAPNYVVHIREWRTNLLAIAKYGPGRDTVVEVSLAHELGHVYFHIVSQTDPIPLPFRKVRASIETARAAGTAVPSQRQTFEEFTDSYSEAVARMWENCMRRSGRSVPVFDADPQKGQPALLDPGVLTLGGTPGEVWAMIKQWAQNLGPRN
jgi:hypothetical protein